MFLCRNKARDGPSPARVLLAGAGVGVQPQPQQQLLTGQRQLVPAGTAGCSALSQGRCLWKRRHSSR